MGAYNDQVLFIHIPKTAGWSVKRYMQAVLPDVLMPDDPASKLPIGHVRLQDIERFTGRSPDSFAKIVAVVRNPYAQQLSQWLFWRDRYAKGGRHIHDVIAAAYPDLSGFLEDPRCDFHVWYDQHIGFRPGQTIEEQAGQGDFTIVAGAEPTEAVLVRRYEPAPEGTNRYRHFGGIFRYWITVDDEIPANLEILRTETLDEELPAALAPFSRPGAVLAEVGHLNRSPRVGNVRAYYTPRAAQLVEEKAAWLFREYEEYYDRWLYSSFA